MALWRPAMLLAGQAAQTEPIQQPAVYYAQMYASRAIPLGIAASAICFASAYGTVEGPVTAG